MLPILPIAVAALATMPIGFLWYSPLLFATPWMHLSKVHHTQMKKGPGVFPFFVALFSSVVIAAIMSVLMHYLNISTVHSASKLGLLLWFAFDFLPSWMRHLFDRRPAELVLINSGHMAANILAIGWILVAMQ